MFGREAAERTRLEGLCRQQLADNLVLTSLQGGLMPVYSGIATLGVLHAMGRGGHQVSDGVWTVGRFTSYLTMFLAMAQRTLVAARILNGVHAGKAAWARLEAYLPTSPIRGRAVHQPTPAAPRIVANCLSMSYGARAALTGLSFTIEPGQFVGVTGPVSCGETSLGLVLAGLHPYEGHLEYGSHELRGLTLEDSLPMIAYLGQEGFLFSDSISASIELGPADARAPSLAECVELSELPRTCRSSQKGTKLRLESLVCGCRVDTGRG